MTLAWQINVLPCPNCLMTESSPQPVQLELFPAPGFSFKTTSLGLHTASPAVMDECQECLVETLLHVKTMDKG